MGNIRLDLDSDILDDACAFERAEFIARRLGNIISARQGEEVTIGSVLNEYKGLDPYTHGEAPEPGNYFDFKSRGYTFDSLDIYADCGIDEFNRSQFFLYDIEPLAVMSSVLYEIGTWTDVKESFFKDVARDYCLFSYGYSEEVEGDLADLDILVEQIYEEYLNYCRHVTQGDMLEDKYYSSYIKGIQGLLGDLVSEEFVMNNFSELCEEIFSMCGEERHIVMLSSETIAKYYEHEDLYPECALKEKMRELISIFSSPCGGRYADAEVYEGNYVALFIIGSNYDYLRYPCFKSIVDEINATYDELEESLCPEGQGGSFFCAICFSSIYSMYINKLSTTCCILK